MRQKVDRANNSKRSIGLASGQGGSWQAGPLPEASLACQGLSKPFLANVALLTEASLAFQEQPWVAPDRQG
jgi:hypothetical protein